MLAIRELAAKHGGRAVAFRSGLRVVLSDLHASISFRAELDARGATYRAEIAKGGKAIRYTITAEGR